MDAYRSAVPKGRYAKDAHASALCKAQAAFSANAKGPMFSAFAARLKKVMEGFMLSGTYLREKFKKLLDVGAVGRLPR